MTHVLLLAAVVIWGSTFVATKVCLAHMTTLQLVASRFLIATPALYGVARWRGASFELGPLRGRLAWAAAIFSTHFLLQTWALERTTATHTGWIVAVTPLTIALSAAVLLRETISGAMRLGLAVATSGVVLIVSGGELTELAWLSSAGDWMVLASTFTWAGYTLVTRDLSRARDPVVVALVMTLPLAAAALVLPFTLETWTPAGSLPLDAVVALAFLGVAGVALAQWFWQVGVAGLGAAKAGTFLYVEPLATTALAVAYLGEPLNAATLAGGTLVIGGVYLAERPRARAYNRKRNGEVPSSRAP